MDEIPAALRETQKSEKSTTNLNLVPISILVGTLIISSSLLFFYRNTNSVGSLPTNTQEEINQEPIIEVEKDLNVGTTDSLEEELEEEIDSEANQNIPEHLLGHLPYPEASPSELKVIAADGSIKLKEDAADKFLAMQAAARASGIVLVPLSGFRSISEQEYLFFQVKEQRSQATSKRAEVSAPPGYSEHHTGYAVDIGDGRVPATNLSTSFENTAAYQWLVNNAAKYSFELSFSADNLQGISYEPWHWRYVGNSDSLETFYKARNLKSRLK